MPKHFWEILTGALCGVLTALCILALVLIITGCTSPMKVDADACAKIIASAIQECQQPRRR